MRLLIDIPKEFEQHFQADRFEDSLHRLSADAHLIAGLYEQETASMLIEAFATAVPVPKHGDLIDRQAFRYEMDKHYPFDNATQRRHGIEDVLKSAVLRMLFDAPTIIPADKEVEE